MGTLLNRTGRYLIALLLLGLLAMPACDEDPAGADETHIRVAIHAGNNQTERAGAMLPQQLTALVRNLTNTPQPGIEVRFEAIAPGGIVTPASATTGSDGLASCTYTLGPGAGEQRVKAVVTGADSTLFTATAVAVGCNEENPTKLCVWPSDRIYITTTSSTLLDAVGTVLIEYDPVTGDAVKLFETAHYLRDISFSSRGELFVSNVEQLMKVDPTLYTLSIHTGFSVHQDQEFKPNSGGILAGVTNAGPLAITCYPPGYFYLDLPALLQNVRWECLAAHPVTRDLFIVTGSGPPTYQVWRIPWDGRADAATSVAHATINNTAQATPRGMDIDSTGTLYISFDGDGSFRRVVRVFSDGTVDDDFVDLWAMAGSSASRWGDIAYGGGKLYLIDTHNNRLAVITAETGAVTLLNEDFRLSKSGDESERYGIAVRPPWMCAGGD